MNGHNVSFEYKVMNWVGENAKFTIWQNDGNELMMEEKPFIMKDNISFDVLSSTNVLDQKLVLYCRSILHSIDFCGGGNPLVFLTTPLP